MERICRHKIVKKKIKVYKELITFDKYVSLKRSDRSLTQHYDTRNFQKFLLNSFYFVHLLLGMQLPLRTFFLPVRLPWRKPHFNLTVIKQALLDKGNGIWCKYMQTLCKLSLSPWVYIFIILLLLRNLFPWWSHPLWYL